MTADPVTRLFEAMQARRWEEARACLAGDAEIAWPATNERFGADAFIAMNRAYPEGWSIELVETLAESERMAARVKVTHGDAVHWCAGFYTVTDDLIAAATEYWTREGSESPPEWRVGLATSG